MNAADRQIPLFDLHCHLDLFPEPSRAFEECRKSKIVTLTVTTTPRAWAQNRKWATGNPYVLPALGLHPELVGSHGGEVEQLMGALEGVSIIGEIGLDGSPRYRTSYEHQRRIFKSVVAGAAREPGRILSIHSRSAVKDVLKVLEPQSRTLRPILHWFLGTPSELKTAVGLGCYFSVNGAMVGSERGKVVIGAIPADRLLIESDAPFRKEAATTAGRLTDLEATIKSVALLRGSTLLAVRAQIATNSCDLLGISLPLSNQ